MASWRPPRRVRARRVRASRPHPRRRACCCTGANAPLPPVDRAMAAPLASLRRRRTTTTTRSSGRARRSSAEEDDAKDDAEGVETEEAFAHAVAASASARRPRRARASRARGRAPRAVEPARRSSAASAATSRGRGFPRGVVSIRRRRPRGASPAHHAVWRAEQSALILCSPPRTARLSRRATGGWARMLVQMGAAAAVRCAMGYLWATPRRTWCALTSHSGSRQVMTGTGPQRLCRYPRVRARRLLPAYKPRARAGAPDARRCGRRRHVPAARRIAGAGAVRVSAPTPPPSRSRSCRRGLAEERGALCGGAPAAYDPAWVLPLRWRVARGSLEARDAARWGLAGVLARRRPRTRPRARSPSRRSTAARGVRRDAAARGGRLQGARAARRPSAGDPNGLKNEGRRIARRARRGPGEKGRCDDGGVVAAGLSRPADANKDKNVKNGRISIDRRDPGFLRLDIARLHGDGGVRRGGGGGALHPAATVRHHAARVHAAGADGEALPVNFLGALNGSGGGGGDRAENATVISASREARALRVWVLRLPQLRRGPEDAGVPQGFAAEVPVAQNRRPLRRPLRQASRARRRRARRRRPPPRALVEGAPAGGWRPPARRLPPHKRAPAGRHAAAAAATAAAPPSWRRPRGRSRRPSGHRRRLPRRADARRARPALFAERRGGRGRRARSRVARRCSPRASARRPGAPNDAPLGGVLDPAETRLCRAVAAHDAFLANEKMRPTLGAHRDAARVFMLLVVARRPVRARRGGTRARDARRARLQNRSPPPRSPPPPRWRVSRAANAAAASSNPKRWASRVRGPRRRCERAATARRRGGVEEGGGGAAAFAATLGRS